VILDSIGSADGQQLCCWNPKDGSHAPPEQTRRAAVLPD
jgi:hypothetical protein